MTINVAHEAPVSHITEVQKVTELDFAIAPYVLEYTNYAYLYFTRPANRVLIMDNGKFELGVPLAPKEVIRAAAYTRADYVVAPDYFGDVDQTVAAFKKFILEPLPCKVAAVVVGQTAAEQVACYKLYQQIGHVDMYCWSFLYPRSEALYMLDYDQFDLTKPHHLLGFGTIAELRTTYMRLRSLDLDSVSIDTMKPINATFRGETLKDVGRGRRERPSLDVKLDRELLHYNLGVFRGWMESITR